MSLLRASIATVDLVLLDFVIDLRQKGLPDKIEVAAGM